MDKIYQFLYNKNITNKGNIMAFISKTKIEYFKFRKKYTNLKISELTGIPISNVEKIFSGYNKNPTFDTISEIAKVLECSLDDIIENDNKLPDYYYDSDLAKLAEEIVKNKKLYELVNLLKELNENDVELFFNLVNRIVVEKNKKV